MNSLTSQKIAMVCILVFQVILIIIFAFFAKYDAIAKPPKPIPLDTNATAPTFPEPPYPLFQDIHVMIFVGFGFLMTFLKKYAFSAIGFTFLIASVVIQWGMLIHGFIRFHSVDDRIHLNIVSMMNADIIAAVILISLGAVLGKISPLQLLVMAILETVLFAGNEYLGSEVLEAVDAGGSVYVHAFGAYFGLAVSFVLARGVSAEGAGNDLESSSYQSDISSMIGTLFLWMFWPSFNAGLLTADAKYRAMLNTYLALTASCLTTFAMSSLLSQSKKFGMAHVQNATLAGGVCVGTSVNMLIQPYGALIIGAFAGILSTIGFRFIQGFLHSKLRVHDTCGVNNLHGMPGVAAGIIGAVMAGLANRDSYGLRLYDIFPAMGSSHHRAAEVQAGYQLAGLSSTLAISIFGGLATGLFIRNYGRIGSKYDDELFQNLPEKEYEGKGALLRYAFPRVLPEEYYNDDVWWEISEGDQKQQA